MWCGTWNLGAVDPFLSLGDLSVSGDEVSRLLAPFIPKGLDVYVLAVQEGVSEKMYEAVEQYTGCFRLPLHRRLYSARTAVQEAQGARRSRRMGNAIRVQALINEAKMNITPDPLGNTADMVRASCVRTEAAARPPHPSLCPSYTAFPPPTPCAPPSHPQTLTPFPHPHPCGSWIVCGVEAMELCSHQSTRA